MTPADHLFLAVVPGMPGDPERVRLTAGPLRPRFRAQVRKLPPRAWWQFFVIDTRAARVVRSGSAAQWEAALDAALLERNLAEQADAWRS